MKITLELDGNYNIHEYYTHDSQLIMAIDKLLFSSSVTEYYSLDKSTHEITEHKMMGDNKLERYDADES